MVLVYQHRNENDFFSSFMFRCQILTLRCSCFESKTVSLPFVTTSITVLASVPEQESDSKNIKYQNIYKNLHKTSFWIRAGGFKVQGLHRHHRVIIKTSLFV